MLQTLPKLLLLGRWQTAETGVILQRTFLLRGGEILIAAQPIPGMAARLGPHLSLSGAGRLISRRTPLLRWRWRMIRLSGTRRRTLRRRMLLGRVEVSLSVPRRGRERPSPTPRAAAASHSAMYFPRITFPVLYLCLPPRCSRCASSGSTFLTDSLLHPAAHPDRPANRNPNISHGFYPGPADR